MSYETDQVMRTIQEYGRVQFTLGVQQARRTLAGSCEDLAIELIVAERGAGTDTSDEALVAYLREPSGKPLGVILARICTLNFATPLPNVSQSAEGLDGAPR